MADEACVGWGLQGGDITVNFPSLEAIAELRTAQTTSSKATERRSTLQVGSVLQRSEAQDRSEQRLYTTGTLATISPLRARVLPKRHNPDIGITLRSLSSNLAFHRSAVNVVWIDGQRDQNPLAERLAVASHVEPSIVTALLLPFPLTIKTTDFRPELRDEQQVLPVSMLPNYQFFTCAPER